MRLRLNTTLRAALIAAITAVGFTSLSSGTIAVAVGAALLAGQQAMAEDVTIALPTDRGYQITNATGEAIGAGSNLNSTITTISGDSTKLGSAGTYVGGNNGSFGFNHEGDDDEAKLTLGGAGDYTLNLWGRSGKGGETVVYVLKPDGLTNGEYLDSLTFNATKSCDIGIGIGLAVVRSDGSGIVQSAIADSITKGTASSVSITNLEWSNDYRILALVRGVGGPSTANHVEGITLTATLGQAPEDYTWNGTGENHTWSSAVWNTATEQGIPFKDNGNAVFTASGNAMVDITTEVSATGVTVSGQSYTFTLTSGGSLTAASLMVTDGASLAIAGAGTVEVSGAIAVTGTNALTIGEDATLKLTNGDVAKALMKNSSVANNGTLELGADVTIGTTADSSTIGGTLLIKGHTLSLGNAEGQEASIHSFSSIQLDNGIISFNNKQDNLQNLGVAKDKTGVISVYDMGQDGAALVLDGTTNINGTLTIQNEWNAQFDIKKLAGSGTLNIKGTNGAESSRQAATYTIGSVEGGFAGTVNIINSSATVKLADGAKLGSMEIGPGSLLVDTGVTATIGNLKVRDNRDATITVNGALNVTQMVTIGALKTLSINSTQDGGAKTLTTTTLGFDNVDAKISLQGVKLVVNDAATAGTIDPHNTNRGLMTVGSGASLELNGGVQWNTSDSKCADLVIENGGAVSVAAGTGNKIRNITLNASGGAITFSNSTNTVASLSVAAPAQGATTSVTIASDATLTINGGSLSKAITNNGKLIFGGDITASGLEVNKGTTGLIDVNGKTDSGNGFETTSGDSITIVNNGTGATLTPGGHKVTQDNVEYTIQADGTAVTAGSSTNYLTYYQTSGTIASSAIDEYVTAKGGTWVNTSVSDSGVLTVDSYVGYVYAAGGEVKFSDGGEVEMLFVTDDAKVSGFSDYAYMLIGADKTVTLDDEITADNANVVFDATSGVQVTNNGEEEDVYSINDANFQVTADTMTVDGTEEVVVNNSLVVGEITTNNAEGLILNGNVADGVTLNAAAGDIVLAGQTSNTVTVVDLNIAPNSSVMVDNGQEEGTVTVSGVLTGGDATLLANLTLVGGSKLDVNGGDTHALTLGSTLTFDFTDGGLVSLDEDTIAALNGLGNGENLDLIVCADPGLDPLSYGGNYDGLWYNGLFNRVDGLVGDYKVYANEGSFGLTKVSQVPEPTTGTLSLLALAALAARRRRK